MVGSFEKLAQALAQLAPENSPLRSIYKEEPAKEGAYPFLPTHDTSRPSDTKRFSPSWENLKRNVVQIQGIQGKTVGTGFFIDHDGSVLTCSSLVQEQGTGKVLNTVVVVFEGTKYPAESISTSSALGITLLRLFEKKLPQGAILLPLGEWKTDLWIERDFRTFGFKSPDKLNGLYASGEIRGQISKESGIQLLQLASEMIGVEEIRRGMSGAPVYHTATEQIIGLITFLHVKESEKATLCAVPIEVIAEVCPPVKQRLREQKLLRQLSLSNCLRIGQYFTESTFKLFYESLPIPGLLKYDQLGQDKAQALLEQVRDQGRVFEFSNYLQGKRPDIPIKTLIDLPPVSRINFVNRQDELKEACGRYALPYILLEAPTGYGKTELLKAIEQQHFRDGWFCVYVDISESIHSALDLTNMVIKKAGYPNILPLPDISVAGNVLAALLKNRVSFFGASGVVLLIDNRVVAQ